MQDRRVLVALGAGVLLFVVSVSLAADVAVRGRRMFVREGATGEPSRRVVIVGREGNANGPLSPTEFARGAYLRVTLHGASPQTQVFFLEPSGWTSIARGWRFTGSGANPVHQVLVEADGTSPTRIRAILRGDVGALSLGVVPPDPGSGGALSLAGDGDTYCVAFGGAAGGTIMANTESLFRMKGATGEVACPAVPTPSHTSGGCIQVCAPTPPPTPTPTATPTPIPCDTPCMTPTPSTPVPVPSYSPPRPTPTQTPCPTICS